jgi:hypothetical protein
MKDRRIGKFDIDRYVVEYQPEIVLMILKDCIVLRTENAIWKDAFEYVAINPAFSEISMGENPPRYTAEISGTGPYTVEWRKE